MKHFLYLFLASLTFASFSPVCQADAPVPEPQTYTIVQNEVEMKIICQQVFKEGAPVSIRAVITNNGKDPIRIGYFDEHSPFNIRIDSSSGEKVELTGKGHERVGELVDGRHHFFLIELDSKGTYEEDFDLRELFVLKSTEKYNFRIYSNLNPLQPSGFKLNSNLIPFSIQK